MSVLSFAGILMAPFALALVLWLAWTARTRAAVGALAGIGTQLLLIAFLNRDYNPCSGPLSLSPSAPPGSSVSCGGMDPQPWLAAGAIAVCASVAVYSALSRLRTRR